MHVCSATVKELNFLKSPINDPWLVTTFLSNHFPSLVRLMEPYHKDQQCFQNWDQVRDYLLNKEEQNMLRVVGFDVLHCIVSFVPNTSTT